MNEIIRKSCRFGAYHHLVRELEVPAVHQALEGPVPGIETIMSCGSKIDTPCLAASLKIEQFSIHRGSIYMQIRKGAEIRSHLNCLPYVRLFMDFFDVDSGCGLRTERTWIQKR